MKRRSLKGFRFFMELEIFYGKIALRSNPLQIINPTGFFQSYKQCKII